MNVAVRLKQIMALIAAAILLVLPVRAQPIFSEAQGLVLLAAFTDRGTQCGLLLPWEAATLRAITEDAGRNWDGDDARVAEDVAALSAATPCDDPVLGDFLASSRRNLEGEYLSLFLVAYRALLELEPPPEMVANLIRRTDPVADSRTIEAKIDALAASGASPDGGGPWPEFVTRTSEGVRGLGALLGGSGPEQEEAAFWIGSSVAVAELWLANEDAALLCGLEPGARVHLAGTVLAGDHLVYGFGPGLSFELRPVPAGWDVAVVDGTGVDRSAVTPPARPADTNPRHIAGWHFRSADNTGPNAGDVNAPQTLRTFAFALDAATAAQGPAEPDTGAVGQGVLSIEDYGLADLSAGERARMVYLRFGACLTWPEQPAIELSGLYRGGFEQSAFYADDGRGPFWMEFDESAGELVRGFASEAPGRGSFTTVRLRVVGTLESFDPRMVPIVGPHEGRIIVSQILSVEAISDDVFFAHVQESRAASSPSLPGDR